MYSARTYSRASRKTPWANLCTRKKKTTLKPRRRSVTLADAVAATNARSTSWSTALKSLSYVTTTSTTRTIWEKFASLSQTIIMGTPMPSSKFRQRKPWVGITQSLKTWSRPNCCQTCSTKRCSSPSRVRSAVASAKMRCKRVRMSKKTQVGRKGKYSRVSTPSGSFTPKECARIATTRRAE